MASFYIFSFFAIYTQVFLILTYLERRKEIIPTIVDTDRTEYDPVTIIVPCWNEGKTVKGTLESLLQLDYPKDKLTIKVVDDGSTDDTWQVLQEYRTYQNIELIQKENEGGKHYAVNHALETTTTSFVGCLDADSFVRPDALKKMMMYFNNPETMAVAPSMVVHNPENILQMAQRTEYDLGVFVKKILGFIGGIHVTPGPFSIYRKKVFDDLGNYRKAHNTEDMEIAYRMQKHGYKIEQCHDAFVETVTPATVYKLYRQRLRWIYGFINNTIDYREMILKSRYGAFSVFTLPTSIIAMLSALYLFGFFLVKWGIDLMHTIERTKVIGFKLPELSKLTTTFDPFFVNTEMISFITVFLYMLLLTSLFIGMYMAHKTWKPHKGMLYFFIIFNFVAPFWLLRAFYDTIFTRKASWR